MRINYCTDCLTAYVGEHDCSNPKPDRDTRDYYFGRINYLLRQEERAERNREWVADHPELCDKE